MLRSTRLLLLLLAGCSAVVEPGPDAAPAPDAGPPDASSPAAAPDALPPARPDGGPDAGHGRSTGKATLTYYWVAEESQYGGPKDTILCDLHAATLATVPLAFARALAIEGSGLLDDRRVINVGGSCACPSGMTTCYIELDPNKYPWGIGADLRALVPYRTIAVDRKRIPLRSRVYVSEFDGAQMPASYGFRHDGCLSADDVGGHITGAHIDFFVAQKANYLALDKKLRLSSVTVFQDPPGCP